MRSAGRPFLCARGALALLAAALTCGAALAQQTAPPDLPLRFQPHGAAPDQKKKPRARSLPALQPYKGAQRLGLRGGAVPLRSAAAPGPTIAALPTPPPRRRIPPEENPYDPLGERIGNLRLTPYLEEDVGWSSNPASVSGAAKASAFETTEIGAGVDDAGQISNGGTCDDDDVRETHGYGLQGLAQRL